MYLQKLSLLLNHLLPIQSNVSMGLRFQAVMSFTTLFCSSSGSPRDRLVDTNCCTKMPEWGVELRCIRATAAATRCRHDLTQTEVDTFLKHIDHDDVLLAYAAKEELRKVLVDGGGIVETQCVTRVIT